MKKLYKNAGRPVLVSCPSCFETVAGSKQTIIIPLFVGNGAMLYFLNMFINDDLMTCKTPHNQNKRFHANAFVQADDETLKKHLEGRWISDAFRERAMTLIKECPLESE